MSAAKKSPRVKVTVAFLDGSSAQAEGPLATLADRVEFEHRFSVSSTVLSKLEAISDKEGNVLPDADHTGIREEWVVFLVWRLLRRSEASADSYEAFLEKVEDVEIGRPEAAGTRPTGGPSAPAPPPGA